MALTTETWMKQAMKSTKGLKTLPQCKYCKDGGWIGVGPYMLCSNCYLEYRKKSAQKKANEMDAIMGDKNNG